MKGNTQLGRIYSLINYFEPMICSTFAKLSSFIVSFQMASE